MSERSERGIDVVGVHTATAPHQVGALTAMHLVAGYRRGRRARAVVTVDSLCAAAGQLTAVIGRNGSGKSTLLRTLVGAQPALAGDVMVAGTPIHRLDRLERARHVAVVLTDRVEVGLLTAGEVVLLGRHPHTGWRGHLTADDLAIARAAGSRLGVEHLWERPFGELSDGQRQRVLVARALAQQPTVLVLDEPTAYLDVAGRIELILVAADLAGDGIAVIVSTHDLELVLAHADRVWLVSDGAVIDTVPEQLRASGALAAAFSNGSPEVAQVLRRLLVGAGPAAGPLGADRSAGPQSRR